MSKLLSVFNNKKDRVRRTIARGKILQYYARVGKVFVPDRDPKVFEGRVEVDNHADTFVAGRNCLLMGYSERLLQLS